MEKIGSILHKIGTVINLVIAGCYLERSVFGTGDNISRISFGALLMVGSIDLFYEYWRVRETKPTIHANDRPAAA